MGNDRGREPSSIAAALPGGVCYKLPPPLGVLRTVCRHRLKGPHSGFRDVVVSWFPSKRQRELRSALLPIFHGAWSPPANTHSQISTEIPLLGALSNLFLCQLGRELVL